MRTAIYCRLSEEDRNKKIKEADSESIQNQKAMLMKHAADNDWSVHDIYSDDDFAGADRSRPEWQRLIADAEARKFDIVLCKSQSRFSREMEMIEKYLHYLFPLWGIRFVSVVDNADTANKGNKKARQINGLVNEWYLEDISDNIKSVFDSRRADGLHIGSFALYGYLKDPERKGHLIIDEDAAEVVREVFRLYASGYGRTAIAKLLNDRGIPNPTEYKRLKGVHYKPPKHKTGTLWKYFAISNMLTNEMYIGTMVQGKYGSVSYKTKQNKPRPRENWFRVEGTHEAIIERELWDRVQALVRQRAKPFSDGKIGLFARKARCLYCGASMRSSKNRDKYYLKCETRHVSKDSCVGSFIPLAQLEQAVLSELRCLLDENLDKDEVERRLKLSSKPVAKRKQEHHKSFDEKLKEKIEQWIKQENEDDEKDITLNEYFKVDVLTHEHVNTLIDYVRVGKRDTGTKMVPVEIHWAF